MSYDAGTFLFCNRAFNSPSNTATTQQLSTPAYLDRCRITVDPKRQLCLFRSRRSVRIHHYSTRNYIEVPKFLLYLQKRYYLKEIEYTSLMKHVPSLLLGGRYKIIGRFYSGKITYCCAEAEVIITTEGEDFHRRNWTGSQAIANAGPIINQSVQ